MDKKFLVVIFIIFHLTSITVWNLNNEITIPNKTINFFKPYMYGLSLWQSWNIFSPDPYTKETSTRIIVNVKNQTIPYLPKYSKEGMPFLFTRFRKFNDNIIANRDYNLNTPYLIYLCKQFNNIYKEEYEITLQIMYKDIHLPPSKQVIESYETLGDIVCG